MSDSTHPSDELLGQALDAYEQESRAGPVDLEKFLDRFPLVRERLRKAIEMHLQLSQLERAAQPAAAMPERMGRYRIGAELGRGGMAPVYRAHDEELQRDVAVKVLLPDPLRPDRRVRFLREARALARIGHPNVVSIFDVGESGELAYFAMELLEGSLLDAARNPKVLEWGLQAALGLAAAHAAGVLHRDVKPANLLVGADGKLRVADFGLAQLEGDASLTATGQVMGTLRYAAPEQLLGQPTTWASDIYSLGATLLEVLGPAPLDVATRTSDGAVKGGKLTPRTTAGLPRPIAAVLSKALRREPDERYASMQAFADDLRALLEGRRPQAQPRRLGSLIAVGVLVLGAAVAAVVATKRDVPVLLRHTHLLRSGPATGAVGKREVALTAGERRYRVTLESEWLRVERSDGAVRLPLAAYGLEPNGKWSLLDPRDDDLDGVPDVVVTDGHTERVVKLYAPVFGDPQLGWVSRIEGHFNYGSPAVFGDDVWVGDEGTDPNTGLTRRDAKLYRFSLSTGAQREQLEVPGAILSTVQRSGNDLFIDVDSNGNRAGGLFRLKGGAAPLLALGPRSELAGGLTWPVFEGGAVFVGSRNGRLWSLDVEQPEPPRWVRELEGEGQLSYLLQDSQGLCFTTTKMFHCVSPRTGEVLRSAPVKAGCVARPLRVGKAIACGSGRGDGAIYVWRDGASAVDSYPLPREVGCGDAAQPCFAARLVALDGGRLIGATTSGWLLGWHVRDDGARLEPWFQHALRSAVVGTPVPFGKGALVTSYDGWLRLFDLSAEAPRVAFGFHADGPIGSTPAVVDGKWALFTEVGPGVYKVPLPVEPQPRE